MAYNGPDDLLQMRRDFVSAEKELAKLSRRPDHDREKWQKTHAQMRELAVKIQAHPWMAAAENRYQAWMQLRDAAVEG
ncbi:hypothetical protein [Nonomuraea rhodomycinica]|uniref:Uncharacterized protein n=1 Tax=Nonomuraea rhodomycinica TaxID=1712872 RepID=A0A7Y6MF14_9ACTN|nr:hypothetical protein [Nonomuraea rhodomycinica]NUW45527.1 hypothetical protein [Nonomuraea rhodomycinica]